MLPAIVLPAISPEIFSVNLGGFHFALRWYAMAYVAGFIIGWAWFLSLVKRPHLWPDNKAPATPRQLEALLTWIIIGTVLGGRLGFVLMYQPQHYIQNPEQALMIWQGGMSFHGGLVGNITATIVYCRLQKMPILQVLDGVSIVVTPGLFLGRLANFVNSELYGRPSEAPWAVVFPSGPATICPDFWQTACARHPSQIYEAVAEGLILGSVMIWCAYRAGWLRTPGRTGGLFLAIYGFVRFLVEFVREADPHYITPDNPLGHVVRFSDTIGMSMGQLLSLPMICLGLGAVYWLSDRRKLRL
ncbi:MAG: prolipoprotein diacylglyceryl transferase [Rhodobacteraceae bacterium]|nr:prolipoprotein diacylglyceryl transferase [Paracoccaceae bacterium]